MNGALDQPALLELQAALRGGAGPAEALAAVQWSGPLDAVGRAARLGSPLADVARSIDTGDPAADFLVRCLALTERVGGGGAEAVEHALTTIRDEVALQRLLEVRTAQARGTALVLAGLPVAAWLFLVALDARMLAFYATPIGWITGGGAVALAFVSWRWMRRLTAAVAAKAAEADVLSVAAPVRWRRGLVAGALVGVPTALVLGPLAGLLAAAATGCALARPAPVENAAGGGAETVALVAVALEAGLGTATALEEASRLAPGAGAAVLGAAARRAAGGWRTGEVLADTALAPLGARLAAAERWGAPTAPALRALAEDLRAQRRTAVELAAERLQLTLIFPTTLLTLPAFVLGVVPPLLWATVRG